MNGRFDGVGILHERQLQLVIARGWIAVTRDNDKEWDDLHLTIEVAGHPPGGPRWGALAKSPTIVLRPTVDSAGPQLTTWQSRDTIRVLVPWPPSLTPRWLLFDLDYQMVSYAGRRSTCSGTVGTDTIRFGSQAP